MRYLLKIIDSVYTYNGIVATNIRHILLFSSARAPPRNTRSYSALIMQINNYESKYHDSIQFLSTNYAIWFNAIW